MRAVVVGTGTTGSAVNKLLKQDAHQVVTVDRETPIEKRFTPVELLPPKPLMRNKPRHFSGWHLGRYTHRVAISNHRLISFAD